MNLNELPRNPKLCILQHMRRMISLLCALALTVGGLAWLISQLFADRIYFKLIAAAGLMIGLGGYWLWADYIDATPNKPETK